MNLSLLGFAALAVFMALVLSRRLSAVAALILVPIVFGVIAGFGAGLGDMMIEGVVAVAPTALMLIFALLYFAVMIEAGLFEPLVRKILQVTGDDPVKVVVGTAVLAMVVSLDGDGATSAIITISAMYPVYRRLGLNPLVLALLLGLSNTLMNWLPWGGPAARAALALQVDVMSIVGPLLPALGLSLLAVLGLAYGMGRMERRRLALAGPPEPLPEDEAEMLATAPKETRNLWLNLLLTVGLMGGMLSGIAPLPALVMGAFAIAVTLNFPRLSEQKAALAAHGETILMMVSLIFAAGVFTGILNGTGMIDAMAQSLVSTVPEALGPYMGPITAVISMPLLMFMSNDAFYFGVVPVLGATGASYGVAPEVIGRAALMGMPLHGLSPFIAPIYLVASLIRADVGQLQRFGLPWALLCSIFATLAAIVTGAIIIP
ncbi:CitMHS family transporter [Phenylobacterium sp.]|uniref:CitMHS family transporter n=1 Tax=Phenylobacterium sp. TaxID=1871053 RepID=UPI0027300595|nr:citrate:proton symporter [Phenylobacterium sp.]MDP1619265.1 citrate:proton symporter [Phenylobacterium sp.]MDP1986367.1 citrate:proton symporter [Phenylobacterium sp.]